MTTADAIISKFKDHIRSQLADNQPPMEKFSSLVQNSMSRMSETDERKEVFCQAKTDFQRICFLLQAINSSSEECRYGLKQLTQLTRREEIKEMNGKSDSISELYRQYSDIAWNCREIDEALFASTTAVFYAASPEQRSLAFARRCNILFNLGLINEATVDGERALMHPSSQEETVHIHVCMGECLKTLNKFEEAQMHFERAISLYDDRICRSELLSRAQKGLDHCKREIRDTEMETYCSSWQSFRPEPPQLVKKRKTNALDKGNSTEEKQGEISSRLISSPKGLLRLKNTGSLSGWTIELRKDVSIGEILMVEKPYAASLSSERTHYCYFCQRRCYNLIPCKDCAHVGFCSSVCLEDAKNSDGQLREEGKGMPHLFDCHGLLPCILMENSDTIHVAFKCVANTNPDCLLNYICSIGKYEGGRGHQAFVGQRVREIPPEVLDPSDYSSVAWLCACSSEQKEHRLWKFTKIALYLTYCLYLAGYPMKWFDEAEENMNLFFSTPSPSNCPSCTPASWIAACLLFHIQSTSINSFHFDEPITKTQNPLSISEKLFGCCLYPTIALINHSCNPTVSISFADRGVAFLFARRSLSKGTEISLSYGPTYMNADVRERQKLLNRKYFFKCDCEACKNKWENLSNKPEMIRCRRCLISYQESDRDRGCEKCHSKDSSEILNSLEYEWMPRYFQILDEVAWTASDLRVAADQAERAHSILEHPSEALWFIESFHITLMNLMHGIRTVEPWAIVGKRQSSGEHENS